MKNWYVRLVFGVWCITANTLAIAETEGPKMLAVNCNVVLNSGPTDCGLENLWPEQDACPNDISVPCPARCEMLNPPNPEDPFDPGDWQCWNSETYSFQYRGTEVVGGPTTVVNKFSIAPAGGGKKLIPRITGPIKKICAKVFECYCVLNPDGMSASCHTGRQCGTSHLLSLVRSDEDCPAAPPGGGQP